MPRRASPGPSDSIQAFKNRLRKDSRVFALCGAGLSVASGLPTFRDHNGMWRRWKFQELATPGAFRENPGRVWLFYAWRRHLVLKAKPTAGHYALARLAEENENFLCVTQNVDGLSTEAGHPADQLHNLHGNILEVKCSNKKCGSKPVVDTKDPLCPALAPASEDYPPNKTMPLLDQSKPEVQIDPKDLPHCNKCQALLRPGVVWFGETLDPVMGGKIQRWFGGREKSVDIMLLIGTSAELASADQYTQAAREKGAVIVVVNPDAKAGEGLDRWDFHFKEDAAKILPVLFEDIIGKLDF